MGIEQLIAERSAEILRVASAYGATRIRVFGSVAQGRADHQSDLDQLVDLEPDNSLLDLVAIKQDLRDLLGREVDVVTEAAVSQYIRDQVVNDAALL